MFFSLKKAFSSNWPGFVGDAKEQTVPDARSKFPQTGISAGLPLPADAEGNPAGVFLSLKESSGLFLTITRKSEKYKFYFKSEQ